MRRAPHIWLIVWQHTSGDWVPWEFEKASRARNKLYPVQRALREKYPTDTFRIRKFVMVLK